MGRQRHASAIGRSRPRATGRRRWLSAAPLVAVTLALPLLFVTNAGAVHDTGIFQLDGNAQTSVQSNPPASEDWDLICKANLFNATTNPTGCHVAPGYTLPTGSTIATASTFITDAFNASSDNIFKGGTDDADITDWQWKQATPSPNKADLEDAFAAQYTCTAAMVTAGSCSSTYSGHKLMFFGGDRFANSGDTNIGIWFFHNAVTTNGLHTVSGACPVQSGCGFTGVHTAGNVSLGGTTPGDLFVLSAFTGGGAQPTIKIFEWVGDGNATKNYLGSNNCFTNACSLQPLAIPLTPGFSDNRCGGPAVVGDPACALVNASEITSPWLFQDSSSSSPANKFEANEFYEGGIDLSQLGFGNACTSSVLLNTRSSQSGTSVLQDFALGSLGTCTSELHTTPSAGSGGSVSIGGGSVSVTDSATLVVNGVTNWSGTLDTYLCGPIASGPCTTSGVHVSSVPVNQGTTQPIVSDSASLTSAGRYCWLGKFTSSTTGVPNATDSSSNECFTVTPVSPGLVTHATDVNGVAVSGPVTFGSTVYDTATLNGAATEPGTNGGNGLYPSINANNGAFAGNIVFTLVGPNDCATTATGTGSNPSSPVNVTGNVTYGPVGFTPNHPGTYHWQATYTDSGSVNNVPNTVTHNGACNDTLEDVTVSQIPTQITTGPLAYPNDTATISSTATSDLLPAGGTVTFRLFQAASGNTALQNCQGDNGTNTSAGLLYNQAFGTNSTPAHSEDFGTTNYPGGVGSPVAVSANGTFYWRVTYATGDLAHTGIQSNCVENTGFTFASDPGPGTAFS
jgi:hypothetical protein